jgi:multiple antibiotic resistance protein
MEYLNDILKSTVIVALALLPIINPIGNLPIFVSIARGHALTMHRMAARVAINSWIILMSSMLVGTYVLDVFGISLPIVRVAGGMLVVMAGWRMLYSEETDAVRVAVADQAAEFSELEVVKRSFFPMSFPLTAGPGAIAASIALGTASPDAPSNYFIGVIVAFLGTACTIGVVYICYRYATWLLRRFGDIGTMVMMRLMAFILICIGLQMMWTGWADLNGIAR